MELRVGGKYRFSRRLGQGAFGDLYSGVNIKTNEEVAIKLENMATSVPQLQYEAKIYKLFQGEVGFSQVYYFGVEGDFNVMVLDILGPNLEDLFKFCGKQFSLKTVLMLGMQCIDRMESLHSKGFIHRDIKPENFLMGIGKKSHIVYAIDFGLTKRYRDPKTGNHIQFKWKNGLTGTARYASLNAQIGNEQSRRDDLEAIGFVLAYFLRRGSLPWMGIKGKRSVKAELILKAKKDTTFEELLAGQPQEFIDYMNHCRNLDFEQRPDYKYLKGLFESLFYKSGYQMDYEYDWVIKKQEKLKELGMSEEEEKLAQLREEQIRSGKPAQLLKGSSSKNLMLGNGQRSTSQGPGLSLKISKLNIGNYDQDNQITPRSVGSVSSQRDKTAIELEKQERQARRKQRIAQILENVDKSARKPKPLDIIKTSILENLQAELAQSDQLKGIELNRIGSVNSITMPDGASSPKHQSSPVKHSETPSKVLQQQANGKSAIQVKPMGQENGTTLRKPQITPKK